LPLYEYKCPDCAARFEVLQRMSEGPDGVHCPQCGAERVERQLSTFAATSSGSSSWAGASADCGSGACGSGFT